MALVCPICKVAFGSSFSRNKHLRFDHDTGPYYDCMWCEKICFTSHDLKVHINYYHLDIKEYKCDICNKNFSNRRNLFRHIKDIHDIRKAFYVCSFCSHSVATLQQLEKHKKETHFNPKNHYCNYCNFGSKYSQCLKRHIVRKHGRAQTFLIGQCNVCMNYYETTDLSLNTCCADCTFVKTLLEM